MTTPLDRPVWAALSGPQKTLSMGTDRARAYLAAIGPLAATSDDGPEALSDLALLVAERQVLILLQATLPPVPRGCRADAIIDAVQMVATKRVDLPDPVDVIALADQDAPDMLSLAKLTAPGPFGPQTHILGQFYGIRIDGRLAAMAGERMCFSGHAEMSGVCTHPDFRGRGLALRLCSKVTERILARGDRPFLHVRAFNSGAIKLYERLGFAVRQSFGVMQLVPENEKAAPQHRL